MHIIICQRKKAELLGNLVALAGFSVSDAAFVFDPFKLDDTFSDSKPTPDFILVEASLSWRGNSLQSFYGLDISRVLRRDRLLKCPIVFFSLLKKTYFEKNVLIHNKYGLMTAKGSAFLTLPFSIAELNNQIKDTKPLTDDELNDVIVKYCGLEEEWRMIAHQLGGLLSNYQKHHEEIKRVVDCWSASISRFAPAQREHVETFQKILNHPPDSVDSSDLKRALETLDESLQGELPVSGESPLPENINQLPRCPPKGFSKVLLADDEPQPFLINSLRIEYGYDVIGQAYKLSQAKDLLDNGKPDIVLSDLYFKESSRESEIPNKSIGNKFIQYALTHRQYRGSNPPKPIVLVTSKATLRSEIEIRDGAVNCSGANRATDPIFIHGVIWEEARKRGVSQPEVVSGREWKLEYSCRQRMEQFKDDLPKLIKQWAGFGGMVQDTLRLCRLLSRSPVNDDPETVYLAINALEPYEMADVYSLSTVEHIFKETEKVHDYARTPPISESKKAIRNVLHGKIEQFSAVTNAVKFLITSLSSVAKDLASIEKYQRLGDKLNSILSSYSYSGPLLPLLTSLNETLSELIADLPGLPTTPAQRKASAKVASGNIVNIVVVEDNDYWRDVVFAAIEKTKSRLGGGFRIHYQNFDNATDALAAIPSTGKSFAIDGSELDGAKTIAIVDICLPKDREHSANIRSAVEGKTDKFETPRSENGLELIRALSSYKDNTPLIVFSTIDSIGERKAIGNLGVADEDFLVKGVDDEEAIMRALIRMIEKRSKYVIERFEDENGNSRFRINGILIPLTKELNRTFSAIYTICQTSGRNEFSTEEIIGEKGDAISDRSKKTIQDQIYRMRNLILETLRANRIYVNARDFIKTIKSSGDEDFLYQLNAQVMSIDDEGGIESDRETYENEICKVLVVDNDSQTLDQIIEPLERLRYEVRFATNVEDAIQAAKEFLPHIVSLDLQIPHKNEETVLHGVIEDEFEGLEAWRQIRMSLRSTTLGVVVVTADTNKNDLVARAAQVEIPIRNIISKREEDWLNLFLKKLSDERRRIFLGEVADARQDFNEPIVEILDGTDLQNGVLKLAVNGKPIKMKMSQLAKVIGLLLTNPKTLLSFESIRRGIGSDEPVSDSDPKNWPKRFKAIIRDQWLVTLPPTKKKELAEKILESSLRGMRLNVQVIDSRRKRS
jgi:CheY-like chemotaxis protein